MATTDEVQLTFIISAPPDQVAEGDRIFHGHAPWMKDTHHRGGAKALLSYKVARAAELSNPMDLRSKPTGNTCFILTEVYATGAGVEDHFEQAQASWKDFPALLKWLEKCRVTAVASAPIVHALW